MNKKEAIVFILFILGVFLLGSSPTPTGAIIGIPSITSNFIGLIFFLASLILLVSEGELEKKIRNEARELIERNQIITKTKILKSIASKAGCKLEPGGNHWSVYNRKHQFITQIPYHKEIGRGLAKNILSAIAEYGYKKY